MEKLSFPGGNDSRLFFPFDVCRRMDCFYHEANSTYFINYYFSDDYILFRHRSCFLLLLVIYLVVILMMGTKTPIISLLFTIGISVGYLLLKYIYYLISIYAYLIIKYMWL